MAWRWPGDKPLSEPMIVYWRIYASLGLDELMITHHIWEKRSGSKVQTPVNQFNQFSYCIVLHIFMCRTIQCENWLNPVLDNIIWRKIPVFVTYARQITCYQQKWNPYSITHENASVINFCMPLNLSSDVLTWWCHDMEMLSALLAPWVGNSSITGEFPPTKGQWYELLAFYLLPAGTSCRMKQYSWQWFETPWCRFNTLKLKQSVRHFSANIFTDIFLNENVWISLKISLKFFLRFQSTIYQNWFR